MFQNPDDTVLRELMRPGVRIAVVGLSPKPDRDSHRVAAYLQARGFKIIPVHPQAEEVLGEPVYRRLEDVPPPVDIVYIFRRGDETPPFVEVGLKLSPRAFWLPTGVTSDTAAALAAEAGVTMVMDRCMMVEHHRLGSAG